MLRDGDLVVLNNSRVIKARIFSPDGRIEALLVEPLGTNRWLCLARPARKLQVGSQVTLAAVEAVVEDIRPDGMRVMAFASPPDLENHGTTPIPPYFKRDADDDDNVRYQTTFAREPGSIAAPTAGLHFTDNLLATIPHTFVTLHVGLGTFAPIRSENLADHTLHTERYSIPEETAGAVNRAKRVIAVGTTVTRVLESQPPGPLSPHSGETNIFLRPPHALQRVGALLTNFHLPKTTLLMLVSALAGRELILHAYREAVRERYRFFSYGDCMMIV
jgi:S-adenosylmethionine:tRNA ribosyltransferase-isomerase